MWSMESTWISSAFECVDGKGTWMLEPSQLLYIYPISSCSGIPAVASHSQQQADRSAAEGFLYGFDITCIGHLLGNPCHHHWGCSRDWWCVRNFSSQLFREIHPLLPILPAAWELSSKLKMASTDPWKLKSGIFVCTRTTEHLPLYLLQWLLGSPRSSPHPSPWLTGLTAPVPPPQAC